MGEFANLPVANEDAGAGIIPDINRRPISAVALLLVEANIFSLLGFFIIFMIVSNIPDPPPVTVNLNY